MVPAAPVVFSTTTVWPRLVRNRSAKMRAMVSVGPPAANGTTSVTGRDGKLCACVAPIAPKMIPPTASRIRNNFMPCSLLRGAISLALDPGGFDDRPPFLDLGFLICRKPFGLLLLWRGDVEAQLGKARFHGRIGQHLRHRV